MKLISIVPVANQRIMSASDPYMYLTHLVEKYPVYALKALKSTGYKILDNSLIELGGAVDIQRVLTAAELIGAHEIILPDVFRDGPGTICAVMEALDYIKHHDLLGKYKLMAVCQGKDVEEFEQCYQLLAQMPEINVIGIPKVCAKLHPQGRPFFEHLWASTNKTTHLLGLWYSLEELTRYKHPEVIRSVDTCHIAYLAKHDLPDTAVRPDGFTIDLDNDFIDPNALDRMEKIANAKYC